MESSPSQKAEASWQPLPPTERRVAGVMVEKAKTTPSSYPMTVNAIRVGANQKSNRYPPMQLTEDDVEEALVQLRHRGAAVEVISDGRVPKFRHKMYEWLGVDKAELAVMAELLLRGAQTVGELRGRAARMEPIAGLAELQPILDSLEAKNLIVYLSPRGRGCVVTHNLYRPEELDKVRQGHGAGGAESHAPAPAAAPSQPARQTPSPSQSSPPQSSADDQLAVEVTRLRSQLEETRAEVAEFRDLAERLERELEDLKRELGV